MRVCFVMKIVIGRQMLIFKKLVLIVIVNVMLIGCSLQLHKEKQSLNLSAQYYDYIQPSFQRYLTVTETWLRQNRNFISIDSEKELAMNMPFELGDASRSDKAILLVHGLGDSPYSFSDISQSLIQQGFYVQVLLLPGHGSKPQDLTLPRYEDWQRHVDHYANLLKQQFKSVWLGGYSTGGNLVTIHAIEHKNIEGLMLFAPGFQSNIPIIERFAGVAALFVDVVEREETNLVKYSSGVTNGALAYTESAFKLRELLAHNPVSIPSLMVISEADSAVDANAVKNMYLKYFTHPDNQLIWYGNKKENHTKIRYFSMKLEQQKISSGSHMSPLFAPNNAYYGLSGARRKCQVKFLKTPKHHCQKRYDNLWFAAWGYQEEGKKHTRLTWNPHYKALEQSMLMITQ